MLWILGGGACHFLVIVNTAREYYLDVKNASFLRENLLRSLVTQSTWIKEVRGLGSDFEQLSWLPAKRTLCSPFGEVSKTESDITASQQVVCSQGSRRKSPLSDKTPVEEYAFTSLLLDSALQRNIGSEITIILPFRRTHAVSREFGWFPDMTMYLWLKLLAFGFAFLDTAEFVAGKHKEIHISLVICVCVCVCVRTLLWNRHKSKWSIGD